MRRDLSRQASPTRLGLLMHELLELMMLDSSGLELQEDRDRRHYVIVSVLATMPALSLVSTL